MGLKKIGGLLFKSTKSGLKYAGVAAKRGYSGAKYLHGHYQSYKAGELKRLHERRDKERIKAEIRHYKQKYHKKSSINWGQIERMIAGKPSHTSHVRHVKRHVKSHKGKHKGKRIVIYG